MKTTSTASTSSSQRIIELDGIRGLAILLVLLYHFVAVAIPGDSGAVLRVTRQVLSKGWSGVDLFFVLSGFLIAGILIDNRQSSSYFKVFYIRRAFRIFPLYYLFLSLFILLQRFGPQSGWFSQNLFVNAFPNAPYFVHLQNFYMALNGTFGNEYLAVTWSLAIEEHFYLLLPLLVRKTDGRKLPLLFIFFIMLTLIFRAALGSGTYIGFVLTPWRLDALFIGALLAVATRTPSFMDRLRSRLGWVKVLGVGLFVFILYSTLTEDLGSLDHLVIFGCFYAIVILLTLVEKNSWLAILFRSPMLTKLGTVSYGIYLFHQLANGLLHDLIFSSTPEFSSAGTILVTLLAACVTYLFCRAIYQLIEKRFIALGHRQHYSAEPSIHGELPPGQSWRIALGSVQSGWAKWTRSP